MPTPAPETKALVTPVLRGLTLMRYLAEGGATTNLSEVSRLTNINRITLMRLIQTLEHAGMIEPLPQGGHRLGLDFLTLAANAYKQDDLLAAGRRVLESLQSKLSLSCYLVVLDGCEAVYMLRAMPEQGLVSQIRVGSRVLAVQTTPGRILLAQLPQAELESRLQQAQKQQLLPPALTLAQCLEQAREDAKHASLWSYGGYEADIDACAALVRDGHGTALAALSAAGPRSRFNHDPELRTRTEKSLLQAADELSTLL